MTAPVGLRVGWEFLTLYAMRCFSLIMAACRFIEEEFKSSPRPTQSDCATTDCDRKEDLRMFVEALTLH